MKLSALNKVLSVSMLLTAASLSAVDAEIPIAADVIADQVVTTVLAVDAGA
jgi:hypothetical protein